MESPDLTYRLVDLKIKRKHLTRSTLCLKYSWNIINVMTKGKNEKIKISIIYLFLLPPLPSQDGRGGGGVAIPPSPNFFHNKIF